MFNYTREDWPVVQSIMNLTQLVSELKQKKLKVTTARMAI